MKRALVLVVLVVAGVATADEDLSIEMMRWSDNTMSIRALVNVDRFHVGIEAASDNTVGALIQADLLQRPITPYVTAAVSTTAADLGIGLRGRLTPNFAAVAEYRTVARALGVGLCFSF